MKVWVSRRALSKGLYEAEVRVSGDYVYPHGEWMSLRLGRDCHETREEAVKRAIEMRGAKIVSLKKQLAKLEGLEF